MWFHSWAFRLCENTQSAPTESEAVKPPDKEKVTGLIPISS